MRFLSLLVVSAAALLSSGVDAKTQWHQLHNYSFDDYVAEFHKTFRSHHERMQRKQLFHDRLSVIRAHNARHDASYKMGVNHLTDRTPQELQHLLGYKASPRVASAASSSTSDVDEIDTMKEAADEVDWRLTQPSVIGPVKDQGQCGSCWAFGTTATIESHYALKTGQLTVLSTQQILDCTPNPQKCGGVGGCGGGTPELAYAKLIQQGGQASEWTYPYLSYHGKNFANCSFSPSSLTPVVAPVSGFVVLPSNDGSSVKKAISSVGPLAINVDASKWHMYEEGVFTDCDMKQPDINHVVQLVGYGHDSASGRDYWTIRNSWTPTWGEAGYIRIARTDGKERCGVDVTPGDGTGCTGGPANVTVCGDCGVLYDTSYPIF